MTQYNRLNIKLSNSQLHKLKSGIKNETEVTLNISSNLIGNFNDATSFLHKLLLTNFQNFGKLFQMIHQPTQSFQKLNCLKWYSQKEFVVNYL